MTYYTYRFNKHSEKFLVTVDEYQGEEAINLKCTQLSERTFPKQSQRNKVLKDWIDFLEQHPKQLKKIYCVSRMNQKLFNAICQQENLEELYIKWGMYPDLSEIKNLKQLKYLSLTAGASTKDISSIGQLAKLEVLKLSTVGATDYSALANLTSLEVLSLDSGMDNLIKVDDLMFLESLSKLKDFQTTGFRLLNHDYNPVFSLKKLEMLSINMPAYDHDIWNKQLAERMDYVPRNKHRSWYE